ncbi:hypothetical protein GUJ93_ZPchr0265g29094 [Zizania palustris]|uniref:Uncharacterized protein n=1 Tax=Zizania palustris TaxID=103762 RepID=A0A8J5VD85_ZIZPA|nr:hypothetical protein GUJ93_ZPchr0265g29094 [Zizania palustris]
MALTNEAQIWRHRQLQCSVAALALCPRASASLRARSRACRPSKCALACAGRASTGAPLARTRESAKAQPAVAPDPPARAASREGRLRRPAGVPAQHGGHAPGGGIPARSGAGGPARLGGDRPEWPGGGGPARSGAGGPGRPDGGGPARPDGDSHAWPGGG